VVGFAGGDCGLVCWRACTDEGTTPTRSPAATAAHAIHILAVMVVRLLPI
jgi:hypothetical protein